MGDTFETTFNIEPAHEKDIALPLTFSMRAYFSSCHLWAAKRFSQLTDQIESAGSNPPRFEIEQRAFAITCIISAVAFLEAAINELFQDAADGHESYLAPLASATRTDLAEAWSAGGDRLRVLEKFQLAALLAQVPPFHKDREPYQSAEVLVKFRNHLVHYKPATLSARDEDKKFLARLRSKFRENALMAGSQNPYFPDKCLGAGCTRWVCKTVEAFADDFFGRLGMTPHYRRAEFSSPGIGPELS